MEPEITIFISYSHDSDDHRDKVLALSEQLRKDGLKTILDQYVEGTPNQKWPRWMMDGLDSANFVLTICTETYYRRFRGHEVPDIGKGVDWEGNLIIQKIYDAPNTNSRFIPVIFNSDQQKYIPEPLRGGTYYILDSERNYLKLYSVLRGQAGVEAGEIGEYREIPKRKVQPLFSPENNEQANETASETSQHKQIAIAEMTAKLHEVIIKQVEAILSSNPVLLAELKIEAQLDNAASAIDVAKYLILQNIAGNAIRQLASANLAVEKKLSSQLEKWNEHLDHAEQLCGWFLLNTVDPEWWWANQQQLVQAKQLNVAQSLTLDNTVYIEVVISHNLLKQAKFKVDSYGDLIPDNDMASPYLFDAISPGASDIQLLSEIYKDLRKSTQAPQNVSELIKKIALTANNMVLTTRKGKLIYYIVSKSYLEALQAMDCYADLQAKLAGFVQFICCASGESNATSACTEDQDALLETVAGILRLRNVKR